MSDYLIRPLEAVTLLKMADKWVVGYPPHQTATPAGP